MQIKISRKQIEDLSDRVTRQLEKLVKGPDGKPIANARLDPTVVWNVVATSLLLIGIEIEG